MTENAGLRNTIFAPVALEGNVVRLEPLRAEHIPLLWEAAKDDAIAIFRWIPFAMQTEPGFQSVMEHVLEEQERGVSLGFATVDRKTERLIGSTRFLNIDPANLRVEIGSTWIVPSAQRTAVNTEAKYLMLRHAFEEWKCVRVELKTDALNERSRAAILRLGAKEEGRFRKHWIVWDGRVRDTLCFSIVDTEWPNVREKLEARLRS